MSVEYLINRDDVIVWTNDEWTKFFHENDSDTHPSVFMGEHIFRWIEGTDVQLVYRALLKRVRDTGETLVFPFRCDSPRFKRLMEMEMSAEADDAVRFRMRIVEQAERMPYTIDESLATTMSRLALCAWCNRIKYDGQWMEIEEAIRRLGLMTHPTLPPFTHGICPDCKRDALEDYRRGFGFEHVRLN